MYISFHGILISRLDKHKLIIVHPNYLSPPSGLKGGDLRRCACRARNWSDGRHTGCNYCFCGSLTCKNRKKWKWAWEDPPTPPPSNGKIPTFSRFFGGPLQRRRQWQGQCWIHDNLCYLTINCDTGQHSQFLRCFWYYVCMSHIWR